MDDRDARLGFGIFLAPFHAVDEHPTLAMERDLELVRHLDALAYNEAWIGEHHSGGMEIIASPEIFIAAAAERTKHIRLGTGVVSLPYHHPLMVADRILQLDHMTRGRVMLGVGPGALVADAYKMGIGAEDQRRMMEESLAVIVRLLHGETVTESTDWFQLRDAKLQMTPYSTPTVEMAVAAANSPVGGRMAGKYGIGMLSVGTSTDKGIEAARRNWEICAHEAQQHGNLVSRKNWRVVSFMHVAETREKARENVKFGLEKWVDYFREVTTFPIVPPDVESSVDYMVDTGIAAIGTPDDAIAQIERLYEGTGGFGAFLQFAHNWADWAQTKRSYELIARYVMPHFQNHIAPRVESYDYSATHHGEFAGAGAAAVKAETDRYAEQRATKS
ncbi:MAG: LLM class flavin-dependent oxidoreductase [Pseudomonadota bacterium]